MRLRRFLPLAFRWGALLAALAAGVGPATAQSTSERFADFVPGQSAAPTPYISSDYLPLVRGGFTYKVPGTALLTPGTNDRLTVNGVVCTLAGSCTAGITQLTGDVTAGPGNGSLAATIANTAVTPGSYTLGSFTVNSQGRLSAASSYAGTSCTNQFPRSLNASGAATCASVANADLVNSLITLNAGTGVGLTAPGAMSLGGTYTIGATSDQPQFAGLGLGGAATGANRVSIYGSSSGRIELKVPAAAGTNAITFPAGTTDFSATGGTSQVVKQTSAGGPLTVGQLQCSDLVGGCGSGGSGNTYYVDGSLGNDSNACTASGASACATLAGALAKIPVFLGQIYTVNVADGTYAECVSIKPFMSPIFPGGSAYLQIIGNNATPANVLFTGQCSYPGIGTETAGALMAANAQVLLKGLKIAPASATMFGLQAVYGMVSLVNVQIAGSITYGVGTFHKAQVTAGETVSISGWTGYGVFAGLGGEFNADAVSGSLALSLTPNTTGTSCLRAEINASMDLEGSGTITCPGGSNNVSYFLDADTNGYIYATLPSTSVNSSKPATSAVFRSLHGGGVFLLSTITATHFTNSCTAYEAGHADQGAGGRTFTDVGATSVLNTGTCTLF